MARPQKKGLDYFPLDVTCDKTDSDIEILEAKYKNGFVILIKLYMKIYQDEGYFIRWDEKQSLLLSKRVNVDFNEVNDVINDLVQWGIFNKQLFELHGVLTSNRIQETYIDAVKKRKSVDMIKSLILLNKVNSNINLVNSNINLIDSSIYPQSKVKKSKVNKSKEKESKETVSFPDSGKPKSKKRKEAISPECKKYFMDYYLKEKEVEFYWTPAEAVALNQMIAKIRLISGNKADDEVKKLFYLFIDKIKAADNWVYDNLSLRNMNSKFNEIVPKMKSVNASGRKSNIPKGYEALMAKHQNILKNGKS